MNLTIIYVFRDRDVLRLQRSLDSLAHQTCQDFEVLFVDYGSQPESMEEARQTISHYPWARYLYTHTADKPWNRSHALNIGIREAQAEFIFTADVDIIFAPDFVEALHRLASRGRVTSFQVGYIPRSNRKWDDMTSLHLERRSYPGARGMSLFHRDDLVSIRGFDEFYCFWGREDTDVCNRLASQGVALDFHADPLRLFHQWHPHPKNDERNFPPGWQDLIIAYDDDNSGLPERNLAHDWGRIHANPFLASIHDDATRTVEAKRFVLPYALQHEFDRMGIGEERRFQIMGCRDHQGGRRQAAFDLLNRCGRQVGLNVERLHPKDRHSMVEVWHLLLSFIVTHYGGIDDFGIDRQPDQKILRFGFRKAGASRMTRTEKQA